MLNEQGFMCCLGQVALQCGLKREDIFKRNEPRDTKIMCNYLTSLVEREDSIVLENSALAVLAMNINDDQMFSHKEREQKLKELFSENNIDLQFVGTFDAIREPKYEIRY
jgi:hypothetical protein